jgi:hypothetical protein
MISDRVTTDGIRNAAVWAGLSAAFLLSVSPAVGLCTEACKATYNWTIFRMKFPYLGIGFFAVCLLLFYFRRHDPLRFLFHVAIAGACGAEITFLYAQHSLIKRWCPMCLAVAFCVYAVGIALASGNIAREGQRIEPGRGERMRQLTKGVVLAAALFAGAYVSFLGLGNPESSHAATLSAALGKLDSDIEVYVFTDWFCPACRQAEPEMEKTYPNIMKRARLQFIDDPIHPESMNFIPYNLAFLVREKGKYLEIRKALLDLALRTKEPTQEDVQKAVAKLGVVYRPLNYSDVNAGVQYFLSVVKAFGVEGTPSMVVYNRKTNTRKLLSGVKDLSAPNILMAVSGVAPP